MKINLKIPALICVLVLLCMFPYCVHASETVLDRHTDGKIYDVTAFGADRTGNSLSDEAIINALSAANRDLKKQKLDGKSYAVLYFPGGTYQLTSDIRLASRMIVAAEADTVVNFSSDYGIRFYRTESSGLDGGTWQASDRTMIFFASGAKQARVMNATFKSGSIGVRLYNTSAVIENVSVSGSKNMGMNLSGKSKVTAVNCKINNNGYGYPAKGFLGQGIGVYDKSSLTISGSQMNKNRECGVSVKNATVVITNCKLQDNGRHGLGTAGVCNVTMTGCDIYHNGFKDKLDGVTLVNGSKGKFLNCTFRSNAVTGLLINHGNTNAVIKGCTFKNNVAHNIYSENLGSGKTRIEINGCKFYKCKTSDSVSIRVKKKSGYSLTIKGKNKYYSVKPKYAFWINKKRSVKN